jgi:DNA-directed RNA polymerase subunit RPC12/RpoP
MLFCLDLKSDTIRGYCNSKGRYFMAEKVCPHCNTPVPPGFEVMPVCMMCGGDINAQPTQVWSTVDLKGDKTYNCPACNAEIKSVLVTECHACGTALELAKQDAVAPVTPEVPVATPEPVYAPEPVYVPEPEPVYAPEPVYVPEPEPVYAPEPVVASKPDLVSLPSFVAETTREPQPEPKVETKTEPKPTPRPAKKEGFFDKLLRMFGLKK